VRPLLRRLLRSIRETATLAPADRVAIAVSGGADSVALTWALVDLVALGHLPVTIVGLVHLNHGLRGEDADRDERFVRALGARLGLPVEVGRADVAEEARASRRSLEAAGRAARDRFFAEATSRLDASVVATAHTADDQAETVLLRLLRGASARGVAGIRPRRGAIVRPLLGVRRATLRRFLEARGEGWVEDASNADRTIARNAVRHELLPVVERLAPGGIAALARFAALARDDEAVLERRAIEVARKIVLSTEAAVRVRRAALSGVPAAIARRVVRHALEQVSQGAVTARHVDAIRRLGAADTSIGHLDLPTATVDIDGEDLWLRPRIGPSRAPATDSGRFDVALPVPGAVDLATAGVRLVAERVAPAALPAASNGRGRVAAVQEAALRGALSVRQRRPGDRLRPLGAPGRRKVQDVLVDRKVPRGERDRVPIVVDQSGQIVWVAGYAMADECRVTRPESGVVLLKIIDL
jgi:tRNA(Ile)-lysidine synthase